jgi:hypothetical protein
MILNWFIYRIIIKKIRVMKKIILCFSFLALSCSNDGEKIDVVYVYKVAVTSNCPRVSTSLNGTYRVSEATYNRIEKDYSLGSTCYWTSFQDLSNTARKGYVTSVLKCNSCGD